MKHIKTLRVLSVLTTTFVMLVACIIVGTFWVLVVKTGIINDISEARILAPVVLLILSVLIGVQISFIVSRKVLRPLHTLIGATRSISAGDYSVRVKEYDGGGEFHDLLRSFNLMAEQLQSTEILRNDFIDSFSHEFKTPIVSIRGFAKRLRRGNLEEGQREEYLDFIVSESERLSRLSANILMLSDLEHQVIAGAQADFRLDEQLRDCILLLERQWRGKEIGFSVELPEIIYHGSEEILSQVWINLIDNAIKFTSQGGRIEVTGRVKQDAVIIEVHDSGPGMDMETLNHIFDKFYQGDSARASAGNGLGLSIVRRIVELCDGEITVESQENNGSVFRIGLPYSNRLTPNSGLPA